MFVNLPQSTALLPARSAKKPHCVMSQTMPEMSIPMIQWETTHVSAAAEVQVVGKKNCSCSLSMPLERYENGSLMDTSVFAAAVDLLQNYCLRGQCTGRGLLQLQVFVVAAVLPMLPLDS